MTATEINGVDVTPRVGSVIREDGARLPYRRLEAGSDYVDSGFPGCAFYMPIALGQVAVNITVTGRTLQYRDGGAWVRIRIEYVGDCEPSTYGAGWLRVWPSA